MHSRKGSLSFGGGLCRRQPTADDHYVNRGGGKLWVRGEEGSGATHLFTSHQKDTVYEKFYGMSRT